MRQKKVDVRTILLWRLGALGDTLLLLPTLAALRASFPTSTIVLAARAATAAPALWSGLADSLLDATAPWLAGLAQGEAPPSEALPATIDLAVVWSTSHVQIGHGLRQAGIPAVVGAPIVPDDPIPVAEHYLRTLEPLGVAPVTSWTLQPPPHALQVTDEPWRRATAGDEVPVAIFHPGSGSYRKNWPLAHFLSLAARLRAEGVSVVWTAGLEDAGLRVALERSDERPHVLPELDLAGLTAVVSRASVLVSGDCGVAHLAALAGTPTVTLFGPSDDRRWRPPGPRGRVLNLALPCAPCNNLAMRCPSAICIRALPVAAVHAAILEALAQGRHEASDPVALSPRNTGRPAAPSELSARRSPESAAAAPAPLQLARWDNGHRWATQRRSEPG